MIVTPLHILLQRFSPQIQTVSSIEYVDDWRGEEERGQTTGQNSVDVQMSRREGDFKVRVEKEGTEKIPFLVPQFLVNPQFSDGNRSYAQRRGLLVVR